MGNLIKKVKFFFVKRKADNELTNAILVAEQMFKQNNTRYFVLPDMKHNLRVFTWTQIKKMRQQGLFSQEATEADFIRESFYFTPSRIDKTYMKPETKDKKRKMWLEYYMAYKM